MVQGIGVDIIEIPRIKKMIEADIGFEEKIFTPREINYCRTKFRKEIHYAARFAAKEAFFKALGTGWRDGMSWQDISVENDTLGKPEISLSGKTQEKFSQKNCSRINLTISHTKDTAVAFVVIE